MAFFGHFQPFSSIFGHFWTILAILAFLGFYYFENISGEPTAEKVWMRYQIVAHSYFLIVPKPKLENLAISATTPKIKNVFDFFRYKKLPLLLLALIYKYAVYEDDVFSQFFSTTTTTIDRKYNFEVGFHDSNVI